jgi:hypothetical protein
MSIPHRDQESPKPLSTLAISLQNDLYFHYLQLGILNIGGKNGEAEEKGPWQHAPDLSHLQ